LDNNEDVDDEPVNSFMFVRNAALFLLRLQRQFHVPKSTVQLIVNEMRSMHEIGLGSLMLSLTSRLHAEGLETCHVEQIIHELKKDDVFRLAFSTESGLLRSEHRRVRYYKKNLSFVEPLQIELGLNDDNVVCFYHYVCLSETLAVLLEDSTVLKCVKSTNICEPGVYTDFRDGQVYQSILCGTGNQPVIDIILYQDAFELVNPLGSAKSLHKMVAMYVALGNLCFADDKHLS
jgi:hypothetical protein